MAVDYMQEICYHLVKKAGKDNKRANTKEGSERAFLTAERK